MYKYLFTKNVLGEDKALSELASDTFDAVVGNLPGTRFVNITRDTEFLHSVGSKYIPRIMFQANADFMDLAEKIENASKHKLDGIMFYGQTTEKSVQELLKLFFQIAEYYDNSKYEYPVIFMYDEMIGSTSFAMEMEKMRGRSDFPKTFKPGFAIHLPEGKPESKIAFLDSDMLVFDMLRKNKDFVEDLDTKFKGSNISLGYMSYELMGEDVLEYFKHTQERAAEYKVNPISEIEYIYTYFNLGLRDTVDGVPLRLPNGVNIIIPKEQKYKLIKEHKHDETVIWYQVEAYVLRIRHIGWIPGTIGRATYASKA